MSLESVKGQSPVPPVFSRTLSLPKMSTARSLFSSLRMSSVMSGQLSGSSRASSVNFCFFIFGESFILTGEADGLLFRDP